MRFLCDSNALLRRSCWAQQVDGGPAAPARTRTVTRAAQTRLASEIVALSRRARRLPQQIIISSRPHYYFMHTVAERIRNSTAVPTIFIFLTRRSLRLNFCGIRRKMLMRAASKSNFERLLEEGFVFDCRRRGGAGGDVCEEHRRLLRSKHMAPRRVCVGRFE